MTNREKLQRLRDSMPAVLAALIEIVQEREPDEPAASAAVTGRTHVELWGAINAYAEACGGDTSSNITGVVRQKAVAEVETAIAARVTASATSPAEGALQPGDVVRLRSGGPAMTVVAAHSIAHHPIGAVDVAYFVEAMEQRTGTYPPAALRRVEDEQALELKARLSQLGAAYKLIERGYEAIVEVERYLVASPSALSKEMLTEKIGVARETLFGALAEDA